MMYDAAKAKGNPVAYKTFEGDIKNELIWSRNFFTVQLHGRLSFANDYMPDHFNFSVQIRHLHGCV